MERTLSKAQNLNGEKSTINYLDPKGVDLNELYGYMHPATREWKDGLIMALLVNNNKHVLGVGNTGLSRCLYLRVHSIGVQVLPMCIPTVFTCVE